MKKICISLFTVLMLFILSAIVFADSKKSSSNLFLCSDSASSTDEIKGDIYAFAKNININNIVGGDIISFGQNITVNSNKVLGNIRGAAQSINIDVKNTKNITVAGEEINIGSNTNSNEIYVAGENINFKGNANDLYVYGQDIVIDGKVNGNLDIKGQNIIITKNANILGSVDIKSSNEPVIKGNIASNDINYEKIVHEKNLKLEIKFNWMSTIMSIITAVIVALLLFIIFENYFSQVEKNINLYLGKYILCGLVLLILTPIAIVLLFLAVIGIPIGLILLVLYILLIYLSPMVTGIILGHKMLKEKNKYIQVVCGVITIKLLLLVPFVDTIIWFICVMLTLGSAVVKILSTINSKSSNV